MRITISYGGRRQRRNSNGKKKNDWFSAWKAKKVASGTWQDKLDKGGKK